MNSFRMSVEFGPFPGPQSLPTEIIRDAAHFPNRTFIQVACPAGREALTWLVPSAYQVTESAFMIVEAQHWEKTDWLARRSYRTQGVKFPDVYPGKAGTIEGEFLAVLWESLAAPIISGREELG